MARETAVKPPLKGPVFAHFTEAEQAHVNRIIPRALDMFTRLGVHRDRLEVQMDLEAVHARVPLDLAKLAAADRFNFGHDVAGIYNHLNRTTGELEDFFLPRCAARKEQAAG